MTSYNGKRGLIRLVLVGWKGTLVIVEQRDLLD